MILLLLIFERKCTERKSKVLTAGVLNEVNPNLLVVVQKKDSKRESVNLAGKRSIEFQIMIDGIFAKTNFKFMQ